MKKINLTQGYVTLVDDQDFNRLNQYKWHVLKVGKSIYAVRNTYIDRKRGSIYMHREIMGNPKGVLVDHWKGNGLNNQRSNLRESTKQQNAFNTHDVDGNLPYKGAMRIKRVGRNGRITHPIIAKIKKDGKSIWIGTFKTPELAAEAYDKKAIELFGEFASLNFPEKHVGIRNDRIRDGFPNPLE